MALRRQVDTRGHPLSDKADYDTQLALVQTSVTNADWATARTRAVTLETIRMRNANAIGGGPQTIDWDAKKDEVKGLLDLIDRAEVSAVVNDLDTSVRVDTPNFAEPSA